MSLAFEGWSAQHLSQFSINTDKKWGTSRCPLHEDRNPSLSIDLETGGYHCHSGTCPNPRGNLSKLASLAGLPAPPGSLRSKRAQCVADSLEYVYTLADGTPIGMVKRLVNPSGGKTFRQYRRNGAEWASGLQGLRLPLYRWDRIHSLSSGSLVLWVEGEKCVSAAESIGYVATTSAGGAKGIGRLDVASLDSLRGHRVLVLPDNDKPGNEYARSVVALLGDRCQLLTLPGLQEKGDLADWVAAGGTKEQLDRLVANLGELQPIQLQRASSPVNPAKQTLPELERALVMLSTGEGLSDKDAEFLGVFFEAAKQGQMVAKRLRGKVLEKVSRYGGLLLKLGLNINQVFADEDRLKADLKESDEREASQAEELLELASGWRLFQSSGQPYASFLVENASQKGTYRREVHRFSRSGIQAQLSYQFRKAKGYPPSTETLKTVVNSLEADALFEGPEEPVFLRTAESECRIYIDLCDGQGTAIEVSSAGWRETSDPPVHFIRTRGMLAMTKPVKGGSLERFRKMMGLSENSWILLVSWLLYSLTNHGPFPVLLLEASAGSAKSTTIKILRMLIDPSANALRGKPEDEQALVIQAANNWLVVADNLMQIGDTISNTLCTIATGGSWARRQLFSNDEEAVVSYRRPIVLGGIAGVITKPDLGDRTIKISPPVIPDHKRRRESDVLADFEPMRGEIFGCLLDALVMGLRNRGKVELPPLPRMADFPAFVIECEDALPWPKGSFIKAFSEHKQDQVEDALEGDPLARAIRTLVQMNGEWRGSPTELEARLRKLIVQGEQLPSVRQIGQRIRVLQPYLRQVGVLVDEGRNKHGRFLVLRRVGLDPEISSPSSPSSTKPYKICVSGVTMLEELSSPDNQLSSPGKTSSPSACCLCGKNLPDGRVYRCENCELEGIHARN